MVPAPEVAPRPVPAALRCPRCRARIAHAGSSTASSITPSSVHCMRAGAQGSSSGLPAAAVPLTWATTSSTSADGEGNAMFAAIPSPWWSPPGARLVPRANDNCWVSQRSTPCAGTATTSPAKGSPGGSERMPAKAATSVLVRSAR